MPPPTELPLLLRGRGGGGGHAWFAPWEKIFHAGEKTDRGCGITRKADGLRLGAAEAGRLAGRVFTPGAGGRG